MAEGPARWREPTRLVPLRWGTWTGRSWGGLWLVAAGGTAIAGSNGPAAWLAGLGIATHVAGWAVLPSRGWRRLVAIVPSVAAMVALLAGPAYLTALVVPLLGWFLVRHRPLRVWPMAAFVVAAGIVIARLVPDYHGMPVAASVALVVVVGAAWAARAVHAASARARRTSRRRRVLAP
jgi:hypothetical protein